MNGAVLALILMGAAGLTLALVALSRLAVSEVPDERASPAERELQNEIRELEALELELAIAEELGQVSADLNSINAQVEERRQAVERLAAAIASEKR